MLVLAFVMAGWRRRQQEHQRRQSEWENVREIADEREISKEEWALLREIIERHRPHAPLRAITTRREFDLCIDAEMDGLGPDVNTPEGELRGQMLRDIRIRLGLDYVPLGQRIDNTRDLIPGQTLWVAEPEQVTPQWHRTIVSAVDEAHFYLSPEAGSAPISFHPGDTLRFRLYREEDARYVLSARLLAVEDDPPRWKFEHSGELKRLQARAHYRIRHEQTVEVQILTAPPGTGIRAIDEHSVSARIRGRVTSLSAGGYALMLPQEVSTSALLRFELALPEEASFTVLGRIVDSAPLTGGRYLVRGAFVSMSHERRELITRYVFRQQQHQPAAVEAQHLSVTE